MVEGASCWWRITVGNAVGPCLAGCGTKGTCVVMAVGDAGIPLGFKDAIEELY